ncbi:unnamed protein product [Parnassius apollo]|uniref:(apollo) hypothetical protein n=1 Tax=Parnassius apollo TaxID=110799 RepID=A0A8S3WUZ7_PARAO|nr:unnamed protein product [Parnassius apollo]
MRACSTALLLALSLLVQMSTAEDIYWVGEGDASNEFLEVKEPDNGLVGNLRRLKRQFFWPFSGTSTEAPSEYESATDDRYDEENANDLDEEDENEGSGLPARPEPETKEKTLRVTFVVMEPYLDQYSNRDSEQFQNISRGLADAVNALFEELPGTQKASLIRIQSRLSDEFSCKVTMEILTSGYENTMEIARILKDHIRQRRQLGAFTVDENEFNAVDVTDPANANLDCAVDELRCDDGRCVPDTAWCNGVRECADGSDEASCPLPEGGTDQEQQTIRRGDDDEPEPYDSLSHPDVDREEPGENTRRPDIENEVIPETTTPTTLCATNEFRCDFTRCLPNDRRCDRQPDCDDGTDEAGCPPGKR